jgi:hypothetical protein
MAVAPSSEGFAFDELHESGVLMDVGESGTLSAIQCGFYRISDENLRRRLSEDFDDIPTSLNDAARWMGVPALIFCFGLSSH